VSGSGKKADDSGASSSVFTRLRSGLAKTRGKLLAGVEEILGLKKKIDPQLLDEIETRLLTADLGVEATVYVVERLKTALRRNELNDPDQVLAVLRAGMVELLAPVAKPLALNGGGRKPFVLLVVGVNGSGKTTTIGKLAKYFQDEGRSVLLAAGDTFRTAAIDQIRHWGERTGTPVVAQHSGADPAAVIFDALQSARARAIEVVIADTAGRLHNKDNLMQELGKIRRAIAKFDDTLPVEVLLVLDASMGQNALAQARQFNEVVTVTGIALTKLDGTAKGGVLFSIARNLGIPIRFIGLGEGLEDLRPFQAQDFVAALLDTRA
jgi:fused signal recognition particle receptor